MRILKVVWFFLFSFPLQLQATTLDFEFGTTGYTSAYMPSNYANLAWQNFGYVNTAAYSIDPQWAGKATSGDFVAFAIGYPFTPISFSSTSGSDFFFNGAFFSSYATEGLDLAVNGFSSAGILYQKFFQATSIPTYEVFDWSVTKVEFFAYSSPRGYFGDPTKFIVDDIRLNESPGLSVPEPSATLLLALGLALLGRIRRTNLDN